MSRIALPNLRIGGLRQFSFGDPVYDRANLYPNLDLDFATNKNLTDNKSGKTSLVSFSRSAASSPGTYVDSQGLVKRSAVNLLLQSENLSTSPWVVAAGGGVGVRQNQILAPDGKQTADLLDLDRVTQQINGLNGTYTYSVYLKAGNNSVPFLLAYNATTASSIFAVDFNLSSGTSSVRTGTGTHSIEDVGDGWYRCQITFTVTSTSGIIFYIYNRPTFTGGFYVYGWGAQVEETDPALMGPSAYIKTTSQTLCAPRFDHQPTTGNITTNLLTYSEMFDVGWITQGGSPVINANVTTAPDGTLTADRISGGAIGLRPTGRGALLTYSLHVKPDATNTFGMLYQDRYVITLNVDTETIVSQSIFNSGVLNNVTFEDAGGGWKRISITTTHTTLSGSIFQFARIDATAGALFFWGAQVEDKSSVGTYVRTLGETRSISDATAESLGLLVEEQRENLLLYSEDFSNVYWTKGGAGTFTYNAEVAPDGTQTAMRMTGTRYIAKINHPITAGTAYTTSMFVKDDGAGSIRFWSQIETGGYVTADIDTVNWTVISSGFTNSPVITDFGNGWHRISLTETAGVTGNKVVSYWDVGIGSGAVLLWGAQLEIGSFVSSYMPTTTSTQTRYADVAAIQDEDFSVTNLLSYSESFDVGWTPVRSTVTANTETSPDGQTTADEWIEDTTVTNSHDIRSLNLSFTNGVPYSFSVYAKPKATNPRNVIEMRINGSASDAATFNISTGTVIWTGSSTTYASIEDAGNGWYKCTVMSDTIATSTYQNYIFLCRDTYTGGGNGDIYTGDGVSGIYLWGASLTATSYPVDYVSTRNLLTDSQDFERSAWVKVSSPVTNNATIAPDGTPTGDLIAIANQIYQLTPVVAATYTFSVYARSETGTEKFRIKAFSSTDGNANSSDFTATTSWQRFSFSFTWTGTGGNIALRDPSTGGTNNIFFWGAQLEPGSTATEYYRTYDVVGKNYIWYEPTEATVYYEFANTLQTTNVRFLQLDNGTETTRFQIGNNTVFNNAALINAGALQYLNNVTLLDSAKIATAFKYNSANTAQNGILSTPDTTVEIPTFTTFRIGATSGGIEIPNGHAKRIIYFPRRIKDSNLVLMTE